MASKLYLRNTSTHGITGTGDGLLFDLVKDVAGSSVDTTVTNTTAGGTEIQATKTAGGSTVAWISGRAPSGGFTLTDVDISVWQVESNMNANIGGRFRVFKRTAAGVITEIGGGPFNDGVEMNTSDREDTWATPTVGALTDTAFAEDDRILLRYYVTNVGTMANGHTGTMKFNAADATTGDSFFNIAETVTFKPNAQTIAPSAIVSAEAFGTSKLSRTVSTTAIASAEAIGTLSIGGALGIGDGLVSFWKLDEATGTTRNDSAGTNHLSDVGSGVTKVSPGKVGDAAGFDQTAYLSIADNASLSLTGSMSGVAGIRLNASNTSDFPGIMGKWAHTNQRAYTCRYDKGTNRFVLQVSPDGTGAAAIGVAADTFGAVPTGTWCLVQWFVDLDNDLIGIRVNSNDPGDWDTAAYTSSGVFDSSAAFEIGRLGTSENVIYADIDLAGMWSRRLSEANWSTLWNNGNWLEIISPVAKAGLDQTRMELETVFLDGSQSVGDGLSYAWTQISGTSVTLNNSTTPNPNFTAPDVSTPENLVFELEVEETDLDTATDQVTITIVPTGSTTWLWHTPLEADIDPGVFYNTFDSMPSPAMVLRNGRVIGAKGDVTLEGYTWSASKMLTALIAAREIFLGNIDYSDTIPNSDVPTSPLATLQQFLSMTSDYDLSPHSPGDHYAYNNSSVHHYGTHLKTTFYSGDDHVETLQNAYVTPLDFEDTLTYNAAGFMSGWDGGWHLSTRDLARIAQLVLQGGVWEGTQILDPGFCNHELWIEQIPEAATQSTDETDEFTNQAATSAIMKDGWSLGWWYLHPGVGVAVECVAMQGLYGTYVYISRAQGLIAASCNLGGTTTESPTPLTTAQFAQIVNAVETPASQFITGVGAIASAQAFGSPTASGSIGPSAIASAEAVGSVTLSQGSSNISPTAIGTAEVVNEFILSVTVVPSAVASSEVVGTASLVQMVAPSAIASNEVIGTASLSQTISPLTIASSESFGTSIISRGAVTISVSAIAPAEAFGSHMLAPGAAILTPSPITSSEAIGSAIVSSGELILTPSSITSTETLGTASIARTISTSGTASSEAFGTASLAREIATTGIATAENFGTVFLSRNVSTSGIASAEVLGSAIVSSGALFVVLSGIGSAESFGTAIISPGSVTISVSGITSAEALGDLVVSSGAFFVLPSTITSAEAFGSTTLSPGAVTVSPSIITSTETIGDAVVSTGALFLVPPSVVSAEGFGSATIQPGAVTVSPNSIATSEAVGAQLLGLAVQTTSITSQEAVGGTALHQSLITLSVASGESVGSLIISSGGVILSPSAVTSLESFGTTTLSTGSVSITLTSIASAEDVPGPNIETSALIQASAIASLEALGMAQLNRMLLIPGVTSTEAFGAAFVQMAGPGSIGRTNNPRRFATISTRKSPSTEVKHG